MCYTFLTIFFTNRAATNRRHMVAVTQFILITVVYVISFIPLLLRINNSLPWRFLFYIYYINHISNFFIYLAVNKEFRKEMKKLVNVMVNKVRPSHEPTLFSLN